ncbi:MAG TPA: hypothetical protein VGK10_12080 [Prolixibacteraceae bacterium]
MRPFVLVLFLLCMFTTSGQSKVPLSTALGVDKEYLTYRKVLIFKPERYLKLKTLEGKRLGSRHYTYSAKRIVLDQRDTVQFDQISWMKGSVYGNQERISLGALMALSAVPLAYLPVIMSAYATGPLMIVAVPCVGLLVEGISLTGARKFRRSRDWQVKMFK